MNGSRYFSDMDLLKNSISKEHSKWSIMAALLVFLLAAYGAIEIIKTSIGWVKEEPLKEITITLKSIDQELKLMNEERCRPPKPERRME